MPSKILVLPPLQQPDQNSRAERQSDQCDHRLQEVERCHCPAQRAPVHHADDRNSYAGPRRVIGLSEIENLLAINGHRNRADGNVELSCSRLRDEVGHVLGFDEAIVQLLRLCDLTPEFDAEARPCAIGPFNANGAASLTPTTSSRGSTAEVASCACANGNTDNHTINRQAIRRTIASRKVAPSASDALRIR
jgi:hypothetical protein